MEFARPRILLSRCLEMEACRYNGQRIPDEFVRRLIPHVEFLTPCLEADAGLGIPRDPIRLIHEEGKTRVYQPASQRDVSDEMQNTMNVYPWKNWSPDGAILKSRSPSCGILSVKIYNGKTSNTLKRGRGVFAEEVLRRYPNLPLEDEGRLRNFILREQFLTAIYTRADFRENVIEGRATNLVSFHSRHKLLFMGWNQQALRRMGKIVANHENLPWKEQLDSYWKELQQALNRSPKRGALINVLLHAFGGFKEELESQEKQFFLNSLEEFRDERIPLSVPSYMLLQWAHRFDNQYLLGQSFFQPFPKELIDMGDSGKGRNL